MNISHQPEWAGKLKPQIKFVKTDPNAILPKRNHDHDSIGDVGYDLFATETIKFQQEVQE